MHKVYARQLRHEIQCSNDQQIKPWLRNSLNKYILLLHCFNRELSLCWIMTPNDLIWSTIVTYIDLYTDIFHCFYCNLYVVISHVLSDWNLKLWMNECCQMMVIDEIEQDRDAWKRSPLSCSYLASFYFYWSSSLYVQIRQRYLWCDGSLTRSRRRMISNITKVICAIYRHSTTVCAKISTTCGARTRRSSGKNVT